MAVCCGARGSGKVGPVKVNGLPLTATWVMAIFDLLVLVTAMGTELVLPTGTLPKLTAEVEVEN